MVYSSEGSYAVMGFYVISGYVITLALTSHYFKYDGGFGHFWLNRFLRLYPTYAFCALLGFVVIAAFPEIAENVNFRMLRPESSAGAEALADRGISPALWPLFYIQQVVLISQVTPFEFRSPIQFAPTAWSVNMELYYYLVLSLGVTASFANARKFLKIAITFIVIYLAMLALHEFKLVRLDWGRPFLSTTPHTVFYRTFLGITVFFALGAYTFHLRKLRVEPIQRLVITALILLIPWIGIPGYFGRTFGYLAFGIGITFVIRMWSDNQPQGWLRFLGDMSYPLFLVHWPIAVAVTAITGLEKNSAAFLLVAGTVSVIAAAILVVTLENPIAKLRQRVRAKNPKAR
mgnify:CR=1 FL=1